MIVFELDCKTATYIAKQVWIIFTLSWHGDDKAKDKLKLRAKHKTIK